MRHVTPLDIFGDASIEAFITAQDQGAEPPSRLVRTAIITLCLATFGFVGWAAVAPVKELVRTKGEIIPSGYVRLVQHLEGGIVQDIPVTEGAYVEKGQLLVVLDGAGTTEDMRQQEMLVAALEFQAEKLRALVEDRAPAFKTDEQVRMFNTAQQALQTERTVLENQIAQKQTLLARLRQESEVAQSNLKLAAENRDIYEKLFKQGYAARTMYIKRQEEYNASKGMAGSLKHQVSEADAELQEYHQRLATLTVQQRDTLYGELQRAETDLAQAREALKKRRDRVARLDVRAPVAGYVKGLKLNTIGAVVPAGQTLMEIVPMDDRLVVEIRIPPGQIGRVTTGQTVQVKVDSFDYVRFGSIPGTITSISPSVFRDEATLEDYYRARVELSRGYAGHNPREHKVIPGMTVDSDIVIGEKTVLAYMMKPIRTATDNALTEQ
ncbi:MAG: HlyD family type I secretion periplasmic adaptor subunit [Bdellovibrionales bacterium]